MKQLKKVKQYSSFNEDKFTEILDRLSNGDSLDPSWRDHPLTNVPKQLKGIRDIHIAPNIVLLYKRTKDTLELIAIGSHQDLHLTEDLDNS